VETYLLGSLAWRGNAPQIASHRYLMGHHLHPSNLLLSFKRNHTNSQSQYLLFWQTNFQLSCLDNRQLRDNSGCGS